MWLRVSAWKLRGLALRASVSPGLVAPGHSGVLPRVVLFSQLNYLLPRREGPCRSLTTPSPTPSPFGGCGVLPAAGNRLAAALLELNARLRVAGLSDEEAATLPSRIDRDLLGHM